MTFFYPGLIYSLSYQSAPFSFLPLTAKRHVLQHAPQHLSSRLPRQPLHRPVSGCYPIAALPPLLRDYVCHDGQPVLHSQVRLSLVSPPLFYLFSKLKHTNLLRHVTHSVSDDRLLFYRERGAGVYGALPYWFSSSLAYIPQCALASVTYCTVVYYMSGLNIAAGM